VKNSTNRRPFLGAGSVAVLLGVLGLGAFVAVLAGGLFGFLKNPFATEQVDRTGPALLVAVRNLARIEGSSGTFQVVVDIEQDAKYMPSTLKGQRLIYLAQGSASGTVELGGISEETMTIDEATKSVRFVVPPAEINNIRVDLEGSRVLSNERGLFDRLGDAFGDNNPMPPELVVRAETQMKEAAQASDLKARAEASTERVLQSIGNGLGYPNVTVEFQTPAFTNTAPVGGS
jgi:Protein of unknown function (DUF4230)